MSSLNPCQVHLRVPSALEEVGTSLVDVQVQVHHPVLLSSISSSMSCSSTSSPSTSSQYLFSNHLLSCRGAFSLAFSFWSMSKYELKVDEEGMSAREGAPGKQVIFNEDPPHWLPLGLREPTLSRINCFGNALPFHVHLQIAEVLGEGHGRERHSGRNCLSNMYMDTWTSCRKPIRKQFLTRGTWRRYLFLEKSTSSTRRHLLIE